MSTRPDSLAPLVFQAASVCLSYPDADVLAAVPVVRAALEGTWALPLFVPVLDHLAAQPDEPPVERASRVQAYHVQEFDLSRRHSLHLSYWTDGDTRRRGVVLAEVKQGYRDSGLAVSLRGELPDHLPVALEFAVADPDRGLALLQRFRASVELLRIACGEDGLPHAGVLEAVCRCLPGESPRTRAEAQALVAEVAPMELVGLSGRG